MMFEHVVVLGLTVLRAALLTLLKRVLNGDKLDGVDFDEQHPHSAACPPSFPAPYSM